MKNSDVIFQLIVFSRYDFVTSQGLESFSWSCEFLQVFDFSLQLGNPVGATASKKEGA